MSVEKQPALPGLAVAPLDEPPSLAPAAGRGEPAVWVSKLAVYRDWPPSKDTLLRQVIELHRGLNILRALPTGSTDEASRLAGHGAGKTTFCRLIRYVLGEEPAGSKSFREGFRAKFSNGWVLAEVVVAGQRWLVGRSLSSRGYNHFAKLDGSIDDEFPESPLRTGFRDYLSAIDAAVFDGMKFRTLVDCQKLLDWPRLLPWLSRDQEAHFSGLLEWRREQDSDSGSPFVSAEDKANLIRMMLGLVDEEEQTLLAAFARKAEAHEQKTRERPKLEFLVERERRLLEDKLGIQVETPDAPLLQRKVDQKVRGLRNEADHALASVKQDEEMDKLIAEASARRAEWGFANALIEELEEAIELAEARVKGAQPPSKKSRSERDPYREALKGLGPFPGYCSHPMDKAWRAECPIAHERPKDDEITDTTKKISAEANPQATALAGMQKELERRKGLSAPKKLALETAVGALTLARERHQKDLEKLKAPAQEAAGIEALLASYRRACADLGKLDNEMKDLKREKEDLDAKLAELTVHHKKLLEQFGRIYNHLVHQMLGNAVTGSVRFSGKSIVPELEYHGPRDSAAYRVVRWAIFDLAALALGMTNASAHHPRFLLHDSPRESDLVPVIYTALFTAARALEEACNGDPAFQYIVTTTEPPPEGLNRKPWVLEPILDASSEAGRLLGVDV
ncbi:MAG TPA: hypothetical protein VGW37_11340 [Terriglobia bacterium]|nr:hypothetical protein [Terriglobia bacterium]